MICPLRASCKESVNLSHYLNICSNMTEDKYKECEVYKRIASEKKTPAEWQRALTPT